jgi:hypothetical protein
MKKHIMIFAAVMLVLGAAGAALQSSPSNVPPPPGTPEWQQSCVNFSKRLREQIPDITTFAQYDDENCRAMANCLQREMKARNLPENNMDVQTACDYEHDPAPHDERPYQMRLRGYQQ